MAGMLPKRVLLKGFQYSQGCARRGSSGAIGESEARHEAELEGESDFGL